MTAGLRAGAAALSLCAAACGPSLPSATEVAKGQGTDPELHDLARREHLLFRPRGNPEALLGKAVTRTADGTFTIAEELAPGCSVTVRRTPERWQRSYVEELRRVVGGGADFGEIADLKARYGTEARVEVQVRNTERLDADLRGDCGEGLVTMVRVGTGSRFVGNRSEIEASGGVTVMGVGASADGNDARSRNVSFSWDEPQAWLFAIGNGQRGRRMELNAAMPTLLKDGDNYRITVLPNQAVWLIVYYVEANGRVGKLLPNMHHQVIAVGPHERRELPEFRATLNEPRTEAQEWIKVCGFDDPNYVTRFAPPKGDPSPEQMERWHKELPDKLKEIGARHWECEEIGYRVVPATSAPPTP